MTRPKTHIRKSYVPEVNGLKFNDITKSIKWRGTVRMRLAGTDESLLGECQWPDKKSPVYYACAVTGLLFDKKTGRCVQSTNVDLDLSSLAPAKPRDMSRHLKRHDMKYERSNIRIGKGVGE